MTDSFPIDLFTFRNPTNSRIAAFLAASKDTAFSYPSVGASLHEGDPGIDLDGYNIDHNQVVIGCGERDFERAKQAIREWKMFDMPWVELCWPDTPIEEGRTVAILIRHFGFYSLNAARIVYTIDEPDRFGFAYGTLEDHGESGEERFSVRFDRESGVVAYDLSAFSRPNHLLTRLGYPLTRILQKAFAADSKAAMLRAVKTIG